MRRTTILFLIPMLFACGSTRKQMERAAQYETGGMLAEAHAAYEEVYERRSKEVGAHIGMKRTAQQLLDQKLLQAAMHFGANELETGEKVRTEAVRYKQLMDGKGLALQWDPSVDSQRKSAQRTKARELYAQADEAFRDDRFSLAEELATASVKLDAELKEADYLAKLATLEPRYRQALKAEDLGLWREAHAAYRWITERDVDYKDAWARMAAAKEKAAFTVSYIPLFNTMLYTVQVTGMAGQIEEQLSASVKQAILDLKDPLIILVDRDHTHALLEEQQRNMSGTYDDRYAAEAGKLMGARYVITGRILRFDDLLSRQIEVQMQVLDTENGRIRVADVIRVNKQELTKGGTRVQLLERAALRMAQRLAAFDPHDH